MMPYLQFFQVPFLERTTSRNSQLLQPLFVLDRADCNLYSKRIAFSESTLDSYTCHVSSHYKLVGILGNAICHTDYTLFFSPLVSRLAKRCPAVQVAGMCLTKVFEFLPGCPSCLHFACLSHHKRRCN